MSDSVREALNAMESDIAQGDMTAAQVFTQMKQLVQAALSANGGEALRDEDVESAFWEYDKMRADSSMADREAFKLAVHGMATHPAPPSVAVPEGWHDDAQVAIRNAQSDVFRGSLEDYYETMMLLFARRILSLTAAPSPDHSGDANKMVDDLPGMRDQSDLSGGETDADHIADAGKMDDMGGWTGSITRSQAIKILDRATDKDDPHWEFVVEDFYDEASDTMPTIFHVFAAIGVTEEEYRKATGAENIDWPATDPSVPESDADAVIQFKDELLKSVKPIFRPHIEGVCAVVLERLRTAGDEGED